MSRVVITGHGVLSALGDEPATFFQSLCDGAAPIAPVEVFSTEHTHCDRAFEIKGFDPRHYFGKRNYRPLNRPAQMACVAAGGALEAAGLSEEEDRVGIGMVLGTLYCSVRTIAEFDRNAVTAGPKYAKPMEFANTVINAAAGQTALWHALQGLNSTICAGAGSGLAALIYAADLIRLGRAEALMAGGVEELCFESFHAFERAGMLLHDAESRPVPFGVPEGLLLGEGAGFLIMEGEAHAHARGAEIVAEVIGQASGFDRSRGRDPEHATAIMIETLRRALDSAGLAPDEVGCVSACAMGAPRDALEARALAEVLGPDVPVTAPKASFGEALGATGAFQAIALSETLRQGRLPGIPGLEQTYPCCPLTGLAPETREGGYQTGLITSFSHDGNGHVLVLARPGARS